MSVSIKSAARSAATLSVASGLLLGGLALAGSAHAATPPSFEPDANSAGSVALYNSSGAQITSGSTSVHPFAVYFVASGGNTAGSPVGNNVATAYAATPQDGVNSNNWSNDTLSAGTTFGAAASANYPGSLKNSTNAIAVANSGDFSLDDYIGEYPAASTANPNVYQIRVSTGNPRTYYTMDVQVTGATWTQVYPAPPAPAPSISAITANPVSPAAHGSTVTLTATATNPTAGSVHLFDGTTDKGAVTYNATTGAISATDTPADGGHSYKFTLTPTDTTVTPVSSPVLSYTVNAPVVQNTTTVVSGPTSGSVGDTVTYVATVKAGTSNVSAGAGTVQFKVDGANAGSSVAVSNGTASFGYNLADTASHTITAAFAHASGQLYNDSADTTGVTVTATAAANAPDPQSVVVNVPTGTLVISTPYTAANPFILGNLVLSADGTSYSASANFGNTAATAGNPTADAEGTAGQLTAGATPAQVDAAKAAQSGATGAGNGITITDTRANSQGWVASAQTTDFTNAALNTPINGDLLSFTNLKVKYVAGNAIQGGVTVNDITTFKSSKKSFAANPNHTPGTVAIAGTLSLNNVPTSTKAGQYTATITFTIV